MRIKGEQLYLFSGESKADLKPIAFTTDAVLSLHSLLVEVSPVGRARRFMQGQKGWDIGFSGLLSVSAFDTAFRIGQPITMAITIMRRDLVENGVDLSNVPIKKEYTIVGRGILNQIAVKGAKASISSLRCNIQGNGELGILATRGGFPYILPLVF